MQFVFAFLFVVSAAFVGASHVDLSSWNQFKLEHNKVYDQQEERLRFKIFSENLRKIEEHNALYNAGLTTYWKGVNQFSDMTKEEFKNYLTLSGEAPALNNSLGLHKAKPGFKAPASIDYRQKGAVNPVRHQGQCGSCWAFSSVACLESINYLGTGKLLSLSEQNLVDCSTQSRGCNGGSRPGAFEYIRDNGLESRNDYPYIEADGVCQFNPSKSVVSISGYKIVPQGNEEALKSAVAQAGPVSVGIDATELDDYKGGIFYAKNRNFKLNHGVVVVGYGSENGEDYWIVRNSWGPNWGEKGYIRIARNAGNQIGISELGAYPVL